MLKVKAVVGLGELQLVVDISREGGRRLSVEEQQRGAVLRPKGDHLVYGGTVGHHEKHLLLPIQIVVAKDGGIDDRSPRDLIA